MENDKAGKKDKLEHTKTQKLSSELNRKSKATAKEHRNNPPQDNEKYNRASRSFRYQRRRKHPEEAYIYIPKNSQKMQISAIEPLDSISAERKKQPLSNSKPDKKQNKRKKTKKTKKSQKKLNVLPDMNFFQFKFLNSEDRIRAIRKLPKPKLKKFYEQEYTEKLLNRFNSDVLDKQEFIKRYKLPFTFNKDLDKLELNPARLKKLFENPSFRDACQLYGIDSLTAKKLVKKKGIEKLRLIINKIKIHEDSLGFESCEKNLRLNHGHLGGIRGKRGFTEEGVGSAHWDGTLGW